MRPSASIVPRDRLDRDIYLVLEDFGARAGCAWRETDEQDTDLETSLSKTRSGCPVSCLLPGQRAPIRLASCLSHQFAPRKGHRG